MEHDDELRTPELSDLQAARDRLRDVTLVTPVVRDDRLDEDLGCSAWLKCENRQPTGAFKVRGATNAVALLREAGVDRDVATHSSGNHGAALAWAARRYGRRAHVVMPRDAVPGKIEAVRHQGGRVVLCEPGQAPREEGLAALVDEGLVPVPPYDHPHIIAGQGTAAMELIEQVPGLDVLVTPLGGGGLLAGTAIAARALAPGAEVIGVEPAGASDTHASLSRGERVTQWQPQTVADGLRAIVGVMNFDIIREKSDGVLLVSEEGIVEAMRRVMDRLGMVIEPSAAVVVAALREHPGRFAGRRVGLVISGGNADRDRFPWLRERGENEHAPV